MNLCKYYLFFATCLVFTANMFGMQAEAVCADIDAQSRISQVAGQSLEMAEPGTTPSIAKGTLFVIQSSDDKIFHFDPRAMAIFAFVDKRIQPKKNFVKVPFDSNGMRGLHKFINFLNYHYITRTLLEGKVDCLQLEFVRYHLFTRWTLAEAAMLTRILYCFGNAPLLAQALEVVAHVLYEQRATFRHDGDFVKNLQLPEQLDMLIGEKIAKIIGVKKFLALYPECDAKRKSSAIERSLLTALYCR